MPSSFAERAPPLVGRDDELHVLTGYLDATRAGRGALVLLSGEAGIGKTALVGALRADATQRGVRALTGRCYDLTETPPYGPWLDLFMQYRAGAGDPPLPAPFAAPGVLAPVGSQSTLLHSVREYFAALAAQSPLLIVLEDLHWTDPASLDLLRFLCRSLASLPLLLVVTYRDEEVPRSHPLYPLLPLLAREETTARLTLHALSDDAVHALVAQRYAPSDRDTARLVAYLRERAEGNPLFVTELLRTLEERGILATDMGARDRHIGDLRQIAVPELLRLVIEGRAARLGAVAHGLLGVGAVIGQAVSLDAWRAVAQTDMETLADYAERAEAAGIVAVDTDGSGVHFRHALIREALYAGVPPIRRRDIHLRAAEYLVGHADRDPDAISYHFQQAGDARAINWLIRAGERAQAAYAYLTATERYAAALRLMEVSGASSGQMSWLHMRRAWLNAFSNLTQAVQDADAALRLSRLAGDEALSACARFARGHYLCSLLDFRNGLPEARAGLDALHQLPDGDRVWTEMLHSVGVPAIFSPQGLMAYNLACVGAYTEAREFGERTIRLSRHADGAGAALSADLHAGLFVAYAFLGEPEAARRALADCRHMLHGTGQYLVIGQVEFYELAYLHMIYEPEHIAARHRLVNAVREAWEKVDGVLPGDHFPAISGLLPQFIEGRWDEARMQIVAWTPLTPLHTLLHPLIGVIAHASGDAAAAWRVIHDALPE